MTDPSPWEKTQITAAGAEVRRWVQMGILDETWIPAIEAMFRTEADDTFDPDSRFGRFLQKISVGWAEDREDLTAVLEIAFKDGLIRDVDDMERLQEVAHRIGWSPE